MHPTLMKEKYQRNIFHYYLLSATFSVPVQSAGVVQLGWAGSWSRRVTGVKTLIGPRSLAPSHRRSSVSSVPGVSISRAAQQK